MDVKALKLSKTMEDMIKAATLHQERVTDDIISGDVVIHGMRVMGRTNTIVALLDRGMVTVEAGCHWLTEDGLAVRAALTGESLEAPPFHELGDDITPEDHPTESDMITGTIPAETEFQNGVNESKRRTVEAWLLNYAWMGTDEQKAATVRCIMAQNDWESVDWVAERFESTQSGDDSQERITGNEFALSALYECHEGPHIDGCGDSVLPVDDSACEPEILEQMRADATGCDDCKGDHDVLVPCRIHRDPIAYSKHVDALMSDVLTNELPGDAERAWDAENAAMEAASIRDEYLGDVVEEIINRVITADDIMIKTPRTFVSMSYLNTMRRVHAERVASYDRWKTVQYSILADRTNLFALIDSVYAAGKISFGMADREKRKIRNITRPTLGSKHKPSKSRRNRH